MDVRYYMEYSTNRKYFEVNKKPLFGGVILFLIGGALIRVRFLVDNWLVYFACIAAFIVGGLLIVNFFTGGLKDSEVDALVNAEIAKAEAANKERLETAERRTKVTKTYTCTDFVFDKSVATLFRKGRDGKCRSNVCKVTVLSICAGNLYLYTHSFSLIEDKTEDTFEKLPLETIESIELTENKVPCTYGKKVFVATEKLLNVKSEKGISAFPTKEDALLTEMIDRTLSLAKAKKKELAEQKPEEN